MLVPEYPASASGCRNTAIHESADGGKIFLTESGAIGMEFHGRISVHSIAQWIAYSWNDLTNTHARNFPDEAASGRSRSSTLRLGAGDAAVSLRGHPYER